MLCYLPGLKERILIMNEIGQYLEKAGITPTPVRMLVYGCLRDSRSPMSLSDIETKLETVDKSSISRTISLFRRHDLLHSIEDGSGSSKYELWTSHKTNEDSGAHVHFRCIKCGETLCLESVKIPDVKLPEGFKKKEINYVIVGYCPECSDKN